MCSENIGTDGDVLPQGRAASLAERSSHQTRSTGQACF